MRFTDKDKAALTLTEYFFVLSRHVTSRIPASIVRPVYVIPTAQTRASQTREVSANMAMDIAVLHNVSLSVAAQCFQETEVLASSLAEHARKF
jgi:hypothetical protein